MLGVFPRTHAHTHEYRSISPGEKKVTQLENINNTTCRWSAGGEFVLSNSEKDNAVHYWAVRDPESVASTRVAHGHTR